MSDQTPTFLNDDEGGDVIRRDSGWLTTWEAAITYFSRWPWPMLVPRQVDPQFAGRVLAAVTEVSEQKKLNIGSRLPRWHEVCGISGTSQ
jgi:hypothetical protein